MYKFRYVIYLNLIICIQLSSDTWAPPEPQRYCSSNKNYCLEIIPGDSMHRCQGILSALGEEDEYHQIWSTLLVNGVSPVSAIVSDQGDYVATFDNWYRIGWGDDVVAIYRKNYFIEHSADQTGGNRNTLFDHALDLIETKKRIGKLLDVGTGCGFFLIAAWERGWQVKGVEPSIQSVELAQEEYGLDVFNGTLRDYNDDSPFDVITFNNVLEHSVLPWQEIALANKLLQPGGLVYLRFPNGVLHSHVCLAARK